MNGGLRTQSGASAQEVLAGLVERVTFHNAENGFCVLRVKARGHRDLVTVVGHAATISAGEWVPHRATGSTTAPTASSSGRRFLQAAQPPTTLEGIERYLASGMIRGIGPVYAKKLVGASARRCSTSSRQSPSACAR